MRKIFALSAALVLLSSLVATADESQREQTAEDFHFRIFLVITESVDRTPRRSSRLRPGDFLTNWRRNVCQSVVPRDKLGPDICGPSRATTDKSSRARPTPARVARPTPECHGNIGR